VRLVSSGYDCRHQATIARAALAAEGQAVATALAAQGTHVTTRLVDPTSDELLKGVAVEAHGPLLWMYSGHGDLVHPGTRTLLADEEKQSPTRLADSVLCLADGPLPIERVVLALPPSAPFALMIVNACFSADVDIRSARTEMALVSLSTQMAKTDPASSPLGQAMRQASLANLDRDCDGWLSDGELFAYLQDQAPARGYGAPILKLRRQTHEPTPHLFATTGCHPELPIEREGAGLLFEPYQHHGLWRVRVTGYLSPDAAIVLDGQTIAAKQLHAVGCRFDTGQCFEPLPALSAGND
jgi:hypothetical protein